MICHTQRAPIWAFCFAENVSESRIVVHNSILLDMVRGHVSASTLVFFSKLHTTAIFRLTFLRLKSLMIHDLSKTWFALFRSTYRIPWQMVYFSVYQQEKKKKSLLTNPLRQTMWICTWSLQTTEIFILEKHSFVPFP